MINMNNTTAIDPDKNKRLIILDTETTGINPREGHRIVEIGCVEMINRRLTGRTFHVYINPLKHMDQEVINIHGLTNEFLLDKPVFSHVADEFIDFIKGAELVIHNAKFDVGFMDNEFAMLRRNLPMTYDMCTVIDTLKVSKDELGAPKTLDYLARNYKVDKLVDRTYHGALIDAQLLAYVYIEMTRKQSALNLTAGDNGVNANEIRRLPSDREKLKVILASADELLAHQERLTIVEAKGASPLWLK
ncbi:MAG: DNA polymerase-3 subunit epsilon [Psychrobacter glaciei]|jgi:DNA polymerase-3 subunit epsilon|tara:strand:- start:1435 stop:2175 length:741 start_codon:yes stop_codon:yes gene_type:complete